MTLSSLKVRGVLAIANNPSEHNDFLFDEKDIQDLCKNCPENLPLSLNHEDDWIVGSGKLSAENDGRELIFTGIVDCGYLLYALQQSKDTYYRNAAHYRENIRLKETIDEYLAVQNGQLSLSHNNISMTPIHVGLVYLGQRIGSQGFFSLSKEPLKWRPRNRGLVYKLLGLAFVQRHLFEVRKEKLLKDSEYVGSVGVLINASHTGKHQSQNFPSTMDTSNILQRLLQKEQQSEQAEEPTAPPDKSQKRPLESADADDSPQAKTSRLDKRINDLENFLCAVFENYEPQSEEQSSTEEQFKAQQTEAKEPTPKEENKSAAEQQLSIQDPRVDSIVAILDRLSNNMDRVYQQQQDLLTNYNASQQQSQSITKAAAAPSSYHAAGIAAVTETQKKIAADSKLVNANFSTPSISNLETTKLCKFLPKNNPVASQLLKSFANKVSTLSVNQKDKLKKIMDFK